MIIAFIGGIGSGKTLSAVKMVCESKDKVLCNFAVRSPNCERLRIDHIITEEEVRVKRDGTQVMKKKLNWDFWNDMMESNVPFSIAIDELHNIMHSRMSMSKMNVLMSTWVAQIRKVLGDAKQQHFYIISQKMGRIDISVRDLVGAVIYCEKVVGKDKVHTKVYVDGKAKMKWLQKVFIIRYYFVGELALERFYEFEATRRKTYNYRTSFLGNYYFQFYDSLALVRFGESVYL